MCCNIHFLQELNKGLIFFFLNKFASQTPKIFFSLWKNLNSCVQDQGPETPNLNNKSPSNTVSYRDMSCLSSLQSFS